MKEKEKRNADIGKVLMKKLQIEGRQNEVDKYKLHVEEVDKITSLILGLSSRLAKSENALINLQKNWNEDEEVRIKT
jgi:protein Shroom